MTRTSKAVVLFSAGIVSLTLLLVAVSSQPTKPPRPPGVGGFDLRPEAPCERYQLVCQANRKARDAKNRGEEPCWWYKIGCEARVAAKRAELRRRSWEYEMLKAAQQQVEDARQRELQRKLDDIRRDSDRELEANLRALRMQQELEYMLQQQQLQQRRY